MTIQVHTIKPKTAARVLTLLNPRKAYHRAELHGAQQLPVQGGCVIVSNHGRLDFDSFILARLILGQCRRPVYLMMDHLWFRLPLFGAFMKHGGAVDGTRENALEILNQGKMILTYPGGVREIMNSRFGHEHIDWKGRKGFAHVALAADVPVIPIVGKGVNNGFFFLSSGRILGKLLFRGLFRLGPAYAAYRNPLVLGILPLPLPLSLAFSFPLPCKVTYTVGEPIYPENRLGSEDIDEAAEVLAQRVEVAMQKLIRRPG